MGTAWMNLDSYSLFFQQKRWSAPGTSCFVHVETLHKVEQQDGTRTYTTQIVWSNIPWIPAATQQWFLSGAPERDIHYFLQNVSYQEKVFEKFFVGGGCVGWASRSTHENCRRVGAASEDFKVSFPQRIPRWPTWGCNCVKNWHWSRWRRIMAPQQLAARSREKKYRFEILASQKFWYVLRNFWAADFIISKILSILCEFQIEPLRLWSPFYSNTKKNELTYRDAGSYL